MRRIQWAVPILAALLALPAVAAPTSGMGKTATGGGHGGGESELGIGSGPSASRIEDPARGEPVVNGALTADDVKKLAHRNREQLIYCLEVQRTREPTLAGTVRVAFTVGPDGRVRDASVKSNDTKSGDLAQCVLLRFRSWSFPQSSAGGATKVEYPIVFAPEPTPSR